MSDWWDDLQPWQEDESGSGSDGGGGIGEFLVDDTIEANHNILSDLRDNDFDLDDPSYTNGLLLVGGLFLLAGLLACLLLRCLFACAMKRKARLSERLIQLQDSKSTRGKTLLVLSVLALAALACAVGSLFEVEFIMGKIEDLTQQIVDALLTAFALPERADAALNGVLTAFEGVKESFGDCSFFGFIPGDFIDIVDADEPVAELEEGVTEDLLGIEGSGLDELADEVAGTREDIFQMRDARHGFVWPTMILCLGLIAAYLYTAVREYRRSRAFTATADASVAADDGDESSPGRWKSCGVERRGRCFRVCTLVLACMVWMTAAGALTLSAVAGDICADLDSSVTSILDNGSESAVLAPLIDYYTGDCSDTNVAVESISAAQEVAEATIGVVMEVLTTASAICSEADDDVELMESSLKEVWDTLNEGAELASCSTINGLYRSAVWDELCEELPKGLLALLVSCIILSILLLLLWVQWTFMLWKMRVEGAEKAGEPDPAHSSSSATPPELGMTPLGYSKEARKKAATTTGTGYYANDFGEETQEVRNPRRPNSSALGGRGGAGGDVELTSSPPPRYW